MRLKYLSGFGYVSLRVDRRGTGNSQGSFDDEYSEQEQTDGLQILQWIDKQIWSNGKVFSLFFFIDFDRMNLLGCHLWKILGRFQWITISLSST